MSSPSSTGSDLDDSNPGLPDRDDEAFFPKIDSALNLRLLKRNADTIWTCKERSKNFVMTKEDRVRELFDALCRETGADVVASERKETVTGLLGTELATDVSADLALHRSSRVFKTQTYQYLNRRDVWPRLELPSVARDVVEAERFQPSKLAERLPEVDTNDLERMNIYWQMSPLASPEIKALLNLEVKLQIAVNLRDQQAGGRVKEEIADLDFMPDTYKQSRLNILKLNDDAEWRGHIRKYRKQIQERFRGVSRRGNAFVVDEALSAVVRHLDERISSYNPHVTAKKRHIAISWFLEDLIKIRYRRSTKISARVVRDLVLGSTSRAQDPTAIIHPLLLG